MTGPGSGTPDRTPPAATAELGVVLGNGGGAGLQIFDIDEDAGCFTNVLHRVRIIDLDSFDPERFL
ncbi:hypothetical protein AB0B63_30440 [Micromonospora sp. NPDC049081]|uniref:hypothetical protein n=1 Tax=Micromonospora sp. NPDC049081 TaxID=3155150 RepID=UPI0033D6BADD